ncbi:hypothetical protein PIB30_073681 [Stylosanthes scabra]|uniref:Uncharacterized protein n=1 Tax=Stylosanthes scabra TaxID=79078 RepID=A0ABU6SR98_9FABA|nr:hypothetical protein [Stylosanthes scabra]
MASSSPFRSLDHAINVTKDIFLNKLDVGCWLEAFSNRDCFNTYIAMTTESTKDCMNGTSKYQRKFGYAFVTCASRKISDEILSELKEAEKKYEDISHGVETVTLNSDVVNSLGTDNATEFDTNNDPRKNVRGVDMNQTKT